MPTHAYVAKSLRKCPKTIRWAWLIVTTAFIAGGCGDGGDAGGADAAIQQPDATVAPPHVVYLVFDGLTVTNGLVDDPQGNVSGVLSAPFTAPPFMDGVSNRDAQLALVADGARTVLAPYNIEVVTERPASGEYDMIVVGGDPVDAGFSAGIIGNTPFGCSEAFRSDKNVSFIFENYAPLTKRYASNVVTHIGMVNGVPITKRNGDCMCGASFDCELLDQLCTMGAAGTPVDTAVWTCDSITEVDVGASFLDVFGPAL